MKKNNYDTAFALAIATIVCSSLEGGFSVCYGYTSSSLTLFGNGVVSFIEVISGFGIFAMVLRIRQHSAQPAENIERSSLRITGIGLYVLAGGLVVMSIANFITGQHPTTTVSGIIIAIITIAVIGALVIAKLNVAKRTGSKALLADAKCTRICVYMSTTVLVASVVYELTKFAYADQIGAIGLAYFAYKEARECFLF
ncbi:MAG TPA: cation transporter [Candidatus Kapabacteria bacterium]|nr:cation transporter [Candidatus Kapabacteria bacterium]